MGRDVTTPPSPVTKSTAEAKPASPSVKRLCSSSAPARSRMSESSSESLVMIAVPSGAVEVYAAWAAAGAVRAAAQTAAEARREVSTTPIL